MLTWLADKVFGLLASTRRVRVRAHEAVFLPGSEPFYFVTLTNLSRRDVEVTHVWFDTIPWVAVINPARPLPARLTPDKVWETWIAAAQVPKTPYPLRTACVKLSSGKVIRSREDKDVPPIGQIPGP